MEILESSLNDTIDYISEKYGKGKYHASAIYKEIFRNGKCEFRKLEEFQKSQNLASKLFNDIQLQLLPVTKTYNDDGVTKFITKTNDNLTFETVVIPMKKYKTICISSQIGCKMGCLFCETGKMRFARNLSTTEIVGQLFYAKFVLNEDIKNIVFMGMGEPLDNFDNVMKAIDIFTQPLGFEFSLKSITISTAGLIEQINKLATSDYAQVNLAISINAPNEITRSEIMPINKKNPLQKLKQCLLNYPLKQNNTFFIEYVLIKDINDSIQDAEELVTLLNNLPVKVNLIPLNPACDSIFKSPTKENINDFYNELTKNNIFARKRIEKGQKVKAACGQLGTNIKNKKSRKYG